MKLLVALSQRRRPSSLSLLPITLIIASIPASLEDTAKHALAGVERDMRDGIEAKSGVNNEKDKEATPVARGDYLQKSTISQRLQQLLYRTNPSDRKSWIQILGAITAYC